MTTLLKFITCGSVDDGKSTLIGHMLYDAKLLFADQARALELDSRLGSREGALDYSLLLDGLMAEREQGITIDVAYRYFTTERRSFIVADCPGHEQYTRNMAVGASFADLAVILVDVQSGVSLQTKRHTRVCALMGIKHMVLAVNKMDLVGYAQPRFARVRREFLQYAAEFEFDSIQVIPVSATAGDNVVKPLGNTPWYRGPALLPYLETVNVDRDREGEGFVLPVQRVCRPNHTFRGFQGQIETGRIAVGDTLTVLPSGEEAGVKGILVTDRPEETAAAGQAVTLQLDREVDVSRGCVLVKEAPLQCADMLAATLLWMDDAPLIEGRSYLLKCGTKVLPATVLSIKHRIEVDTGLSVPAQRLFKNELAVCELSLTQPMIFTSFARNKALGGFILMDRVSNMTSACGVVLHAVGRGSNLTWQETDVTREVRARQKAQTPMTLWFTGLSGSGKSALANALEQRLTALGKHTMLLDGDNIRHGLNKNLGFTEADRVENIRRIAEVARLMNDAGLIVLTAFISPYRQDRENARRIIGEESFVEIYVSTPLEECERRDVKGLYKRARLGQIANFTGVSSPYEPPESPNLAIDTTGIAVEEAVEQVLALLERDEALQ